MKTFEIVADGRAIKCLLCGLASCHPADVETRYCGHCHVFHDDLPLLSPATVEGLKERTMAKLRSLRT